MDQPTNPMVSSFLWFLLSLLWSLLVISIYLKNFIRPDILRLLHDLQRRLLHHHHTYIPQSSSPSLFHYARLYSSASLTLNSSATAISASCPNTSDSPTFSLPPNEPTSDTFHGKNIRWELLTSPERAYKLTVSRDDREIIPDYLQMLIRRGKELGAEKPNRTFHANMSGAWEPLVHTHPATFDTVAMEPEVRSLLKTDLGRFMTGRERYGRSGRAWKRGYLIQGPSGSGKSSLIGAISNFTGYDVYDLGLERVGSETELRNLLIRVRNRSIVVVEDVDGIITKMEGKITLSGLLGFTDGLWSSSASERLFIFTARDVEGLDEALLRPGRMDVHIRLGFCSFSMFKEVALRCLGVEDHELFTVIREMLKSKTRMSTAAVVEAMGREDDPTRALQSLVSALSDRIPTQAMAAEDSSEQHDHDEEDEAESICGEDGKSSPG